MLIFSIPKVQTKLAKTITKSLKESYDINLEIKKVDLSFLGSVRLKGVEIRDHHKDTLIFVKSLSTSIVNAKKIIDNDVNLGSVSLDGIDFHLTTYKGETKDNLSIFVAKFDDDTPRDSLKSPFTLQSSSIYINNFNFRMVDENSENSTQFFLNNCGGSLSNFKINGPDVTTNIRGLYFEENNRLQIANFTADFLYSPAKMVFKNTVIETETSEIHAAITLNYQPKDLNDFNNKVKIDAALSKSTLSLQDLNKLYGEFGVEDNLIFSVNLAGTLNNFALSNLTLTSDEGVEVVGDLSLINAINPAKDFAFTGDFKNLKASYIELKSMLPNLLGKTLPTELRRLGRFTLKGKTAIANDQLDVNATIYSKIGVAKTNLRLTNISAIDHSSYKGNVELFNFNVGTFFNEPLFGKLTMVADVNGTGFRVDNINTGIIGTIKELNFKGYSYQNVNVNGLFQNRLFNGNLNIDDEYFKMRFNGLADFSSEINKFDFTANIADADLVKTNLFTRDSISKIKGQFQFDIIGNTLDDIVGITTFNNVAYTNQKKTYDFKRFIVTSTIKKNVKRIDINKNIEANEVAQGYIEGNFAFSELLPIAQNALGSIYTNYTPYKVAPNQFIKFDLAIYNQIVDVFFPEVFIDKNTRIRGNVNANTNAMKLTFNSPKIIAYKNVIDNVSLRMDTKNTLYNTHLTARAITSDYFKAKNFNLLNITKNDTLFFKSEFKSATKTDEVFNIDLYYTFNEASKSVLGIQKSTFNFEENTWGINPKDNSENKVVFDLKTNEFEFSPFKLTSNKQEVTFNGIVKDSTYKDLKFGFKDVKLKSIVPTIDSLSLNGILNGAIDFQQKEGVYSPTGNLSVTDFRINSFKQGDLDLRVKGENSYEKYAVDLTLTNSNRKSISATGEVDFSNKRPIINLDVALDKFQLNAFSPLGQDVLSKIRGEASGKFTVSGFLRNPEVIGELVLKDAGLQFPYLNVDYNFEGDSKIKLVEQQTFLLENIKLVDTKYNTVGDFNGSISHRDFKAWYMNLKISTDNLVVLDTKETEESLYYGTAFIKGDASIYGMTDNLSIELNAITKPNTKFVIPLNDIKTVSNYKLIRFKTDKVAEKEATENEFELNTLKGLQLDLNLEVTKDAIAEVVIDKVNGSLLNGRGNGNLGIKINTRGDFKMDGDFTVDEGKYEFKYGGVVNKTFEVVKGGTITWNGSPTDADLDITAVYTTKANPSVLLTSFNSSRKIPVNLITKITGNLFNSEQEFDIEIPNVSSSIASELDFILNDNDINAKTKQFLSLLVLNTFQNPNKTDFSSTDAIVGTTTDAVAGLLSSMISTKDGKIQFNVNYDIADRTNVADVINDDLVNVEVGTQISDRVVINGKVGVPVGSKTQSSVVGEVKVEVMLNDSGNFRGVIFNRQNEIQYSTEEEGYTQGIGLTYQVNFNSLSDLLKKIGLKKKKEQQNNTKKDSVKIATRSTLTKFKSTKKKN